MERENLTSELQQKTSAEADWQARHTEVEKQHAATQEQLSSVVSERDKLLGERHALQTDIEGKHGAVAELQQRLAAHGAELAAGARQLKQVQAELKAAHARADDAEKTQKELQAEGIGLMRSLDEMRPKLVELTDEKLRLSEKTDALEATVRARDAVIAQLEATADELRDEAATASDSRAKLENTLAGERAALTKDASELQQAYAELQTELADARKAVTGLEDERATLRQVANSNVGEVRRLTDALQAHGAQLAAARGELAEQAQAAAEARDFLARAQADMEALRLDAAQKDEELDRLRADAHAHAAVPAGPSSLDEEMLSALRQQHALELSAARSQVREREAALIAAEAQLHALQRQLAALEDQPQLRPASRGSNARGPPRRPQAGGGSDDLRRASFASAHRPRLPPAPPAALSAFEGLSPEARHKRRVSLGMLKARIDSEVAAATASSPLRRPVGLPVVVEPHSHASSSQSSSTPPPAAHAHPKRPVFMDESHIFWCHSCQGDLVVL